MILAAGLGTRLGALGGERPKPLLPVCDVPLLGYNLALLEAHGFGEVLINLHHRGDLIEAEVGAGTAKLRVTYSREPEILGTGGGIQHAADWLTNGGRDSFLVCNGKLVIDPDLPQLVALHHDSGAAATMLLREVPDAARWGEIDLDGKQRVSSILGELLQSESEIVHRNMFTGVHVLSPRLCERLPQGVSCVIRQGYLPAFRAGERISGLRYHGYFQEHSTPSRYLAGNFAVLSGAAKLRHPPAPLSGTDPTAEIGPGVTLVEPYRIGPGAQIGAGAVIGPEAVIGRRSRIAASATITRSVVWPDAHAAGSIDRAIVTPRGVFPVAES